jgi:hypothetical protein
MPVTSHGKAIPGGAAGGYTGGKGNWGSGPVNTKGPGGNQGNSNSKKQPVFKDQIFEIACTGMKPNTVHKFYYEGIERGQDCIPVYPKPTSSVTVKGSPLKTDSDGKINFKFYFTQDVEKQVDASNKVKFELAGNKKFELRATDSSAYKIVPFTDFKK